MLDRLREKIIQFRDLRDWKQFHDPKNLAEAIAIESAELLENFLWKTCDECRKPPADLVAAIGEEIFYLVGCYKSGQVVVGQLRTERVPLVEVVDIVAESLVAHANDAHYQAFVNFS